METKPNQTRVGLDTLMMNSAMKNPLSPTVINLHSEFKIEYTEQTIKSWQK